MSLLPAYLADWILPSTPLKIITLPPTKTIKNLVILAGELEVTPGAMNSSLTS
jgi:hypothetical protein